MNTVVNELRVYLPYARRFARALTGSQESGDAYIVQTLEALVADRSIFKNFDNSKQALYATFLKLWNSIAINNKPEPRSSDAALASADRNLQALTPKSRQAFLLISLEGFSTEEAAKILNSDVAGIQALLSEATAEISDQIRTDVIIIEDEPLVAMDLESAMQDLGHNVLGIASTHSEALDLVKQKQPGLVLADIQLADGSSGIDAVNDMLDGFSAPIIFITAFPERLLTGEKPEPTFLITKPFDPNVVKAVTSQALFFDQRAQKEPTAV
jgi:DNA-directed RNA polymerase specialized sigma24 family protein